MAKIVKANGQTIEVNPKNGKDFDLDEMQKIVGGHIEIVTLSSGFMVVDEEGKLKQYPVNNKATMLVQSYGIKDVIVGDVLICDSNQIK